MGKIKIMFFTICTLFLQGCPFTMEVINYPWECDNKANHDIEIYAAIPIKGLPEPTIVYPDTSILFGGGDSRTWTVGANTKNSIFEVSTKQEDVFALNDTLCIFILHPDTLKIYLFLEEINKNYNILRRYDVSLQNMRQLNWTIVYPPDETMKNIKMYPPYGSE